MLLHITMDRELSPVIACQLSLASKNPYNCAITKHDNRARQALQGGKKLVSKLNK
jgi:hypothetical protein